MTTVHVVPLHDLTPHEVPGGIGQRHEDSGWLVIEADPTVPDEPCVCGPDLEHVPVSGGPDGWLVTHHSLDGREAGE